MPFTLGAQEESEPDETEVADSGGNDVIDSYNEGMDIYSQLGGMEGR
jgi:hypothetical protein